MSAAFKFAFELTTRRPLLTVSLLGLVTAIVVAFQILSIVESTRRATALEAAKSYSSAISAIRSYYSSVVVTRVQNAGLNVTHDYHDIDGAIPLPATLTIELGEAVSDSESNGEFRLLSNKPFPWRESGGVRDSFEADALRALNPGDSANFSRVEERNGRPELRLAHPVMMKESCVACHNSHPLSPKTDWKVGDVRGIQTVSVPLPDFLAGPGSDTASREVLEHFALVIAVLAIALALIGSLLFGLKLMVNRQERLLKIAKARNKKLASAKLEAESASRMKSEFLSTMSHELRTPLNAVIGFSEAMSAQMHGPIRNKQYVQFSTHINQAGQHLLRIINNILDLSKIEAGNYGVLKTHIDIRTALDKVLDTFVDDPEVASRVWNFDIQSDIPTLFAGEHELRQTFRNLIENAVKFTKNGGTISISAHAVAQGGLDIVIEDDGIGIAQEDISTAMTPFAQIDSGLNRQIDGAGLGLPLSRRFVEIQGGRLTIRASDTGGTRVTLHFPADCVVPAEQVKAA